MASKTILLVEDNPDDEALTVRALVKNNLGGSTGGRSGRRRSARLFIATGQYAERDPNVAPQVVCLDLNLPKV